MKLSLSVRVAEGFLSKEVPVIDLETLARMAAEAKFDALCMRASQIGVQSSPETVAQGKAILDRHGLDVTMVTGDFDIVYNNDSGPQALRNITPHLDLAESLGADLIRVCIKKPEDFPFAHRAAAEGQERGIRLAHQCHAASLFETVDQIEGSLKEIDHPNFGIIFEAGNLDECGEPYGPEVIRRLGPSIFNVYLQNQQMNPQGGITLETYCRGPVTFDVIGFDEPDGIDFRSIFAGLREIDYDGVVTIHQSMPDDGTPAENAIADNAQHLRKLLKR